MKQIQLKTAGDIAVEALKAAIDAAGIPSEQRGNLVGYFCTAWNDKTQIFAQTGAGNAHEAR